MTRRVVAISTACFAAFAGSVMTEPGIPARLESTVGVVNAIGESLTGKAEPFGFGGLPHDLRGREPHEDELLAHPAHAARNGSGKGLVRHRLVVKRPVRLDVDQRDSMGMREREERADLIHDVGLDLLGACLHLAPAEAAEVVVTRMGPHGDSMACGEGHRPVDDSRVAGVETARDVRGAHELEETLLVRADVVDAEAFAHVAIDVDSRHARILR